MGFNISANDYNVLKQSYVKKFIKLYILDFTLNIVDEISGNLIGLDITIDANSDIRRTCNVNLVVNDASFDIQSGGKIWIDKYIRPYVGYENVFTKDIQWYNQGTYLINNPSWDYDGETNTLKFQGIDMMSRLTGLRNGALEGIPHVISEGENVRNAIINTLNLANIKKYIVSECMNTDGAIQPVPYDITIEQGGTIYDILKALRNILPQYQIYFDSNGVFHYEQIPFGDNEPIILNDDLLGNIVISENINTDFENVKNYIEVYGRTHDIDNYAVNVTINGTNITLDIPSLTTIYDGVMVGFTMPSNVNGNIMIGINQQSKLNLVDENGNQITALSKDNYYVIVYQASNSNWLFLGHNQAYAIAKDNNPESPFYVNGTAGIIRIVLYGGEYDNIVSDNLAQQRANIELYWRCRLQDSISLSLIPIPWIDVNYIIEYTTAHSMGTYKYMIQSVSVNYESNEMTINANRYYPYYG